MIFLVNDQQSMMFFRGERKGIENPSTLYNLTGALLAHGYSKEDVAKLMGGNWMRVMKQVWDDPKAEEVNGKSDDMIEQ